MSGNGHLRCPMNYGREDAGRGGRAMCCDLCDLYEQCEELVSPEVLCCTECAESAVCRGDMTAGRHMMDDEVFDDDGDGGNNGSNGDDEDYDDDLGDDYDGDYDEEDDDDLNDDYESRH
jgi:hypothetical protein